MKNTLNQPVLRVYVSPNGVLKVDAVVLKNQKNDRSLDFCKQIFGAIQRLDREARKTA